MRAGTTAHRELRDQPPVERFDFHVHTAPDTADRTVTAVEAAAHGTREGPARDLVLRHGPPRREVEGNSGGSEVKGIQVFGGVVMNWSSGGINPAAVEAMVGLRRRRFGENGRRRGCRANDSRNHFERFNIDRSPVDVFNGTKLVPATHGVLALWREETTWSSPPVISHLEKRSRSSRKRVRARGEDRSAHIPTTTRSTCRSTISARRHRLGAFIEPSLHRRPPCGPILPLERFGRGVAPTVRRNIFRRSEPLAPEAHSGERHGRVSRWNSRHGFAALRHRSARPGMMDAELDQAGRKTLRLFRFGDPIRCAFEHDTEKSPRCRPWRDN